MLALLGLVAAATTALVAAALSQSLPGAPPGTARPAPTFSLGVNIATPTPTVVAATGIRGASQRMITTSGEVWWRTTEGECGGALPVLERSPDRGASWVVVTPDYLGIAQVLSLDATGGADAQVTASVGPRCETQALRTYTQGQFWQSYPDALAEAAYVDPADPSLLMLRGTTVNAPCTDPSGLQSRGSISAVLCDGSVFVKRSENWEQTVVNGAFAVSVTSSDVLVAHADGACVGVAVSRLKATPGERELVGCIPRSTDTIDVAISDSDVGIVVWLGPDVVVL